MAASGTKPRRRSAGGATSLTPLKQLCGLFIRPGRSGRARCWRLTLATMRIRPRRSMDNWPAHCSVSLGFPVPGWSPWPCGTRSLATQTGCLRVRGHRKPRTGGAALSGRQQVPYRANTLLNVARNLRAPESEDSEAHLLETLCLPGIVKATCHGTMELESIHEDQDASP